MSSKALLALILTLTVASPAVADGSLYSGVPKNAGDRSVAAFSDLGAWFGFALPTNERPDLAGAFVGLPFEGIEIQAVSAASGGRSRGRSGRGSTMRGTCWDRT